MKILEDVPPSWALKTSFKYQNQFGSTFLEPKIAKKQKLDFSTFLRDFWPKKGTPKLSLIIQIGTSRFECPWNIL